MKIGNVILNGQVILAPMAGVCNSAYRKICKEMGAALVCTEMVSDKGMIYNSKKTKDMLYFEESERPISQQIFGSDKETFVKAAKMVYEIMKPDIIDINMGCPVPKVAVRSQAGAALLKNPELIYDIVSSVVKEVPVPVTVKIRSGWDSKSINAVEVAQICEKAGASAITIHPRTRSELYSGKADLDIIKKVKENVSIPVIGNGDITDIKSAKHMLDYTKCDAIMIGRGVLGNPWLIKECVDYLEKGIEPDPNYPSEDERIEMLKRVNEYTNGKYIECIHEVIKRNEYNILYAQNDLKTIKKDYKKYYAQLALKDKLYANIRFYSPFLLKIYHKIYIHK